MVAPSRKSTDVLRRVNTALAALAAAAARVRGIDPPSARATGGAYRSDQVAIATKEIVSCR